MVVLYDPFRDRNETALYQRIRKGDVTDPSELDSIDLLKGPLRVDASTCLGCTAIGAKEIKKPAWFRGIYWAKASANRSRLPLMPMIESTKYFFSVTPFDVAFHVF
jgi:hypothetical protein